MEACGILMHQSDIDYLVFGEIEKILEEMERKEWSKGHPAEEQFKSKIQAIVERRKAEYHRNKKLRPPVLMTSDGEIIEGRLEIKDLPPNSLAGEPVSSGEAIGIARVILDPENATINKG